MSPIALRQENRTLLRLGLPLILNYFIEGCPNFINNAMIAHLGVMELAAGAIINAAFISLLLFLYGLLAASSNLIAHYNGENRVKTIGLVVKDTAYLGFICAVFLFLLLYFTGPLLHFAGQSPQVVKLGIQYAHGLMFAVIPDFASMILWQFFIGLGRTTVTLISSLCYVPINIGANYLLMFGHWGFPALGLFGIGLGTAIGYFALLIGMLIYIWMTPPCAIYFKEIRWFKLSFKLSHLPALLKIGLPLGFIWGTDTTFMLGVAFFAGKLGPLVLAAQQIGIQAISLNSMTLSGWGQAISIRTGYALGSKQYQALKPIIGLGLLWGLGFTLISSLLLWLKPLWIIGIDFNVNNPSNHHLVTLAISFLMVFGFYQLLSALRSALFAALRGFKETALPALLSLFCFYGFGLGLGYYLLFDYHLSMITFWYLMLIPLSLVVIGLYWRLYYVMRNLIKRDGPNT